MKQTNKHKLILFLSTLLIFFFSTYNLFSDYESYVIQKGDTLYSISRRYDIPVDELQEYNNITDPSQIRIGLELKIPVDNENSLQSYTVRPGDTLYSIARKYGITLSDLLKLNNLTENSILKIGFELKLSTNITINPYENQQTTNNNGSNNNNVPFWPHGGIIEKPDGELKSGIIIIGIEGDKIHSVSNGIVTWAGPFRGYGKMVFIKSANGFVFGYGGHEALYVEVGDEITIGSELGCLGINPHDNIAKVFFFVSKDGRPYNPELAPRS